MTLYMIGIGLHDEKDISVKGLESVKRCSKVYLETYTSKLAVNIEKLNEFYSKEIIPADREMVEKNAETTILHDAATTDTAFLVVGDAFGATTHMDLRMRCREIGIEVKIIHNASILNAIGVVGLELYKFGKTTSIPFDNEKVRTPYDVFKINDTNRMHTLFLLDLDPKNKRYMTINEAITYLMKMGLEGNRKCVGCAGIGSDNPEIVFGKAEHVREHHFTKIPQCLIIPSELHFMEEDVLEMWKPKQ
jgi:diphthine methyl ester synthase